MAVVVPVAVNPKALLVTAVVPTVAVAVTDWYGYDVAVDNVTVVVVDTGTGAAEADAVNAVGTSTRPPPNTANPTRRSGRPWTVRRRGRWRMTCSRE